MIMLSDTYGFLHLPSRLEEQVYWCIYLVYQNMENSAVSSRALPTTGFY